jgi:hypothetical protein
MTAPRPRIGRLPGLHMGALRLLLGKEPTLYDDGSRRHGSIVRYRYLFARCYTDEDWEALKKALRKEFGPLVREHRRLRRQRRAEARKSLGGRRNGRRPVKSPEVG